MKEKKKRGIFKFLIPMAGLTLFALIRKKTKGTGAKEE